MKLGRKTKVRQNFLCLRLIHHSRYPFFISFVMVQPTSAILILIGLGFRFYSRQSINHVRLNPSSYLPSFLRVMRPLRLPSIHHPSTSSCCFDILPSTTVIVLRSWPSWVCRVSNARGGCDVYPTLASILFCSGCATYPTLVAGVTCTLSSRSFYSFVFSRPSSMFRSPSLSCFCNSSSPVIIPCQSATVRLRPCQCLHGFAIVFPIPHHRIPVVIPLDSRSFSLAPSPSPLFVMFSRFILFSGSTWIFSTPFIPISAFVSSLSISGVLAAQPASSFRASVYSTVVLLSSFCHSGYDVTSGYDVASGCDATTGCDATSSFLLLVASVYSTVVPLWHPSYPSTSIQLRLPL